MTFCNKNYIEPEHLNYKVSYIQNLLLSVKQSLFSKVKKKLPQIVVFIKLGMTTAFKIHQR